MKSPSERIKTIRLSLGMTQAEFAETLGMSTSRYNQIETGRTGITPWGMVALSALEYLQRKRLLKLFLRWEDGSFL